jgi:tRNA/rRNA methyltransferase
LVRPEHPANIGAAARAAANMGLSGLDLVAPGDWRTVDAWRMAWGAQEMLERARVLPRLEEALRGSSYTAALSGRSPAYGKAITVKEMARELSALPEDARAAVVFGPESKGLPERDLLLCQRRVRIPASQDRPSLNLAQAVMVTAYEIFMAESLEGIRPLERASAEDAGRALDAFREALLAIGFLPKENPEARFVEWRELFGRAGVSPREVKLILALARRIQGVGQRARRARSTRP